MRFIFRRRFNYFDVFFISVFSTLMGQGHYVWAIVVLLLGSILSSIGEDRWV